MNETVVARIHSLAEARIALARADGDLLLISAPDMAAFAGVGFWHAVEQALQHTVVIDCGTDAGLAMAALRQGSRDLLFVGPATIAAKLASMAEQLGGRVRREIG